MAMQQVRCPRCGQSYWQGTPHVCPPKPTPPLPPPARYADWRVNFLLNFGVVVAVCWIIGMACLLLGAVFTGVTFISLLQAAGQAARGGQ